MLKKIVAVASLLLLAGCGGDDPAPAVVDGKWSRTEVIVGNSMVMSLASQGSTVTGTGTYAGEAGPFGTFTASGTYQRPQLSLVLQYNDGSMASYSATLSDPSHMNGTLTISGVAVPSVEFVKQ